MERDVILDSAFIDDLNIKFKNNVENNKFSTVFLNTLRYLYKILCYTNNLTKQLLLHDFIIIAIKKLF